MKQARENIRIIIRTLYFQKPSSAVFRTNNIFISFIGTTKLIRFSGNFIQNII